MEAEQYLNDRLEDQINWYDRKSGSNQIWFKRLRFSEILIAATIPFISGHISTEENALPLPIIIGFMGVTIAVIAGVLALFKFQENWLEYRTTAELLKSVRLNL